MNEIRTASMALAAYPASSAIPPDITSVRSFPQFERAYTSLVGFGLGVSYPNTVTAAPLKSAVCALRRNSGFDAAEARAAVQLEAAERS